MKELTFENILSVLIKVSSAFTKVIELRITLISIGPVLLLINSLPVYCEGDID